MLVASETCALDMFQARDIREVEPGEMVIVEGRTRHARSGCPGPRPPRAGAHCIFELIYFARPDSEVFGRSVHMARKSMGEMLARADHVEADIVIAVPDSGNSAALGYSAASGIPLEQGLTRNHYMGRTFIQPTTAMREAGVRMKLHPVREAIAGKRVVVIDDSLVRGTTSRQIVKLLREAGAREVHLRLSSPPLRFPCFYGIDIPTREELISNRLDPEGSRGRSRPTRCGSSPWKPCGSASPNPDDYCYACFSGDYPVPGEGRAGAAASGEERRTMNVKTLQRGRSRHRPG